MKLSGILLGAGLAFATLLYIDIKAFGAPAKLGIAGPKKRRTFASMENEKIPDPFEPFTQFYHKPIEAVKHLLELKRGIAVAALHHAEVGDIDIVYGEYHDKRSHGYGLAKIKEIHPEVIYNLQDVLNECRVKQRDEKKIQLVSKRYKAAVQLFLNKGKNKTNHVWLLTAYEQ
jgi:hypothetical protein